MEVVVGLFFVWWFVVGFGFFRLIGSPYGLFQPLFWLIIGMILLTILVSDALYMIIPFYLNLFLFTVLVIYRVFLLSVGYLQFKDFLLALLSGVFLSVFFVLMNKLTQKLINKDGFGLGDVLLSPSLGLLVGWSKMLVAVFIAFLLGSFVAIFLILTGKKKWGQYLPFGPFLIIGSILALIYGQFLIDTYMSFLV